MARGKKSGACKKAAAEAKESFFDGVDCPTLQKRSDGNVRVRRVVDAGVLSMIDTIGVPSEFLAAVTVVCVPTPNSASEWHKYAHEPHCSQLMFFDVRKSPRVLASLIGNVHMINHTIAGGALPAIDSVVSRRHCLTCQCRLRGCPGSAHRSTLVQRRGANASDLARNGAPSVVPTNQCAFTSPAYDAALASDDASSPGVTYATMFLCDGPTAHPVLPEWDDVEPRRAGEKRREPIDYSANLGALGSAHWRSLLFDEPVLAQPDTYLTLDKCVADEVLAVHESSAHQTPCCARTMRSEISTLAGIPERLRYKGAGSLSADDERKHTNAFLDSVQCDGGAPLCQCALRAYVRRCTFRMTLELLPLPQHQVYADVGDSVVHCSSPTMRLRAVARACDTLAMQPPDSRAESGEEGHYDTVALRSAAVRAHMRDDFDDFAYCGAPGGTLHARPIVESGAHTAFAAHVRKRATRSRRIGDELRALKLPHLRVGERVDGAAYEFVLESCKALHRKAAHVKTLCELALERGMFSDARTFTDYEHLLCDVPARLVASARGVTSQLEERARQIMEYPGNDGVIISPVCERMIVHEMMHCDNARVLLARACVAMIARVNNLESWRSCICHMVGVLCVVLQVIEVAPHLQRAALAKKAAARRASAREQETRRRERKALERARLRRKKELERAERNEARARKAAAKQAAAERLAAECASSSSEEVTHTRRASIASVDDKAIAVPAGADDSLDRAVGSPPKARRKTADNGDAQNTWQQLCALPRLVHIN